MPTLIIAVPGALVIGFTLGLLGSGGSILTVPVLVYMLGQDEKAAIASSLAIVGLISVFGSIPYIKQKMVDWRMVIYFGVPGIIGTYLGAWGSVLVNGAVQLAVFAAVMLVAAVMMIRPVKIKAESANPATSKHPSFYIMLEGLGVGILTGFVGVGGGFVIVPALVLLGGVSMHSAIATSLVIIAMKSFAGFAKYLDVLSGTEIDWAVIGLFSSVGIIGAVLGSRVAPRFPQEKLRRGFSLVLMVMCVFIFLRTLPSLMSV